MTNPTQLWCHASIQQSRKNVHQRPVTAPVPWSTARPRLASAPWDLLDLLRPDQKSRTGVKP